MYAFTKLTLLAARQQEHPECHPPSQIKNLEFKQSDELLYLQRICHWLYIIL